MSESKLTTEGVQEPTGFVRSVKTVTKNRERVRVRREVLIDAAIEVFIEKGYHEATVRDIGRKAGLTQGTIYNYVSSKDDILYMACDRVVAEYNEETRRALAFSRVPAERVRFAITALTEVMYRRRHGIRMIYQNAHELDRRSREVIFARVQESIGLFETILKEAAAELGMPLPNPYLSANILTFLPTMIALRSWSLRGQSDPETTIREISDFLVRGLGLSVNPSE